MARTSRFSTKHLFIGAATTALLSLSVVPPSGADEAPHTETAKQGFDIPQQPLSEALAEFARQSKANVVAPSSLTRGKVSAAVAGEMTPADALARLVVNAGLQIKQSDTGAFIVAQAVASGPKPVQTQLVQTPINRPEATLQTDELPSDADEQEEPLRQEKVTVTGSLIKGFAPDSSPLQMYSREDILDSGSATTEQFIRNLPQNFGGGSSEFASNGLPNDANAASNLSFGTGANLRGLGSGGTLVLLNGARLAPTSSIGDFVDLSMIPVSALERIDVLSDGASSIYGGDAVAGVMNFVLRNDFEGAESALQYGAASNGQMDQYRASQTLGASWRDGNVLATYEFFSRQNLRLSDRPGIASPLQGGNQTSDIARLFDLLPSQHRNSLVVAANQQLTPELKVSGSGLYSKRNSERTSVTAAATAVVQKTDNQSENVSLNLNGDYSFNPDWSAALSVNFSETSNAETGFVSNRASLITTNFDSSVLSADVVVNGDLFDLPGGSIKVALGGHVRREDFIYETSSTGIARDSERDVTAVFGEMFLPLVGSQNSMPGIERLELNISGRLDDYSDFGTTVNPKFGILWVPTDGLLLRSSFSESFAPPPLGRVGELSRTADLFPTSFVTSILGLSGEYPTLEQTDYLIVYGTDTELKPQTSQTFTIGTEFTKDVGRFTWSASANYYEISFENRLGTVPIPDNLDAAYAPFLAIDNPAAFPAGTVIFDPSADQVSDFLNSLSSPVVPLLGASIDNIGIINRARMIRNLSSIETNGFDIQLQSALKTETAEYTVGVNANYILEYAQQASTASPVIDVLNTLYNPVDLKLRAHLGMSQGPLKGALHLNYLGSYQTDTSSASSPIESWVTTDLTLTYKLDHGGRSWLSDTTAALSISNLFDEPPPVTPTLGTFRLAGYDPTNASPIGRFISLEIRKAF